MEDRQNDDQDDTGQSQQSDGGRDNAGSPASHSNSVSSRLDRIVELIQEIDGNVDQLAEWVIRPEFYDEDVAQNPDNMSADETDYDEQSANGWGEDSEDDPDGGVMLDYGFVIAPNDDDLSSYDSDDDADRDQVSNYDTTLPVSHRYLGDDLEESRGRRVLAECSVVTIPLFNLKDIVLLPGQVLPFTTSTLHLRMHMYLLSCIARGSTTIGIMWKPQNNPIGTTAEIRNFSAQDNDVRLIMEGRQRFRLLSTPFENTSEGEIEILPEVSLGQPYPRIPSLLKFKTNSVMPSKFIISNHPHWIYRRCNARYAMSEILDQIKDWCNSDLTKDPNDFSYWLAANLPINNTERMNALSLSCTELRLIWLLEKLEKSEFFGCSNCENVICYKKDVFPMSRSGPQCSFVNPGGFIHDTLTVRSADGLIHDYGWCEEYSWFPGYAWRTAKCASCGQHIGWCYKRMDSVTIPKRFFGLSRTSVRLQSSKSDAPPDVSEAEQSTPGDPN